MGYFPGKQTAQPSRKSKSGGGGGGGSSGPTPMKTSPALTPEENAKRMAYNRSIGIGDSSGRSPTDPNFGKGPTAPSSQFRTGGGAAFVKGKVKTRVVTRAEFQRSLAQKQQRAKAVRRFLKPLEEQRRKTGAAERRRRIDALTMKQKIVKEIKGQPLSEMGRRDKQAVIDFIDRQFEPFIGRKKALFTTGTARKIEKNLDTFLRKEGTKAISRKITPKEPPKFQKPKPGTVTAVKKEKGLAGVRQTLSKQRGIARTTVETDKSQLKRTFTGIVVLGALGLASGVVGVLETIRHPIKTAKAQIEAIKHPQETIRYLGEEFTVDPVGAVAEFYSFAKTVKLGGQGVKRSPVGRYVQEELFIRSQPKQVQGAVRKILRAARIQEKLNPLRIKSLRKVDFFEVQSLNKIEAQALARALRKTDSVVFGSWSARTLGGKKLPKPKDVDIATRDIGGFNRAFIKELPKDLRKNYVIQGQKVLRKVKSLKEATDKFGAKKIRGAIFDPIFDVKPLSRLIPQKSLFTGKGRIPVVGYVTRIKGLERIRKVLRINKQLDKLKSQLKTAKTRKAKARLKRSIRKLEKQRRLELKRFSPSELAQLKKTPAVGGLDFPTQKIVTVKGIKMVGFGEQTVRKALGTLQVLIERSPRRAKDPSSLLKALEVQRAALKRSKKLTLFKKRKLKGLDDAIRMLKSKAFAKLLEKKVPGLTKEYPLVAKISVSKLNKVNFQKVREQVFKRAKKAKPTSPARRERKAAAKRRKGKTFVARVKSRIKERRLNKLSESEYSDAMADKLLKSNKRTFYHQTDSKSAEIILKEGLKGHGRGKIIFLAPGPKGATGTASKGGVMLQVKLTTAQLKRMKAQKGFMDYPLEAVADFKIPPSQIKVLSKPIKRPRKKVQRKKVSRPAAKQKRPSRKPTKRRPSKLPKKKRPSRLPASKLKSRRPSKLRPSRPSKVKAGRARPSRLAPSKPSKLKPSNLKPSRVPPSKPSKLKPSKLRPSKLRPGRPSRLTPSQIRSKLVRLPKGVPRPPPVLLRKPKTKKEEERVIRWVKQQKNIYRPSLAAVLFDITGIPKRKLTGFEIRPIPVFRKVKRRVKKRPKRLKRKASSKRKKKK